MDGAQVVIESISADKKTLNPNGVAFFPAQHISELAASAKAQETELIEATCFVPDISQVASARAELTAVFPGVTANFVQLTRLPVDPQTSCEGVGRLQKPGKSPAKLVFTAIQMSFGDQEKDLRLAYGRLGRVLETTKAGYAGSQMMRIYSLNRSAADKAAALGPEYMGRSARPASVQVVEGLPSLDATVALELIAAGP